MKKKNVLTMCVSLLIFCVLTVCVSAAEADHAGAVIESAGFSEGYLMNDKNERTYSTSWGESSVTVTRNDGVSSMYVVFDRLPPEWVLTDLSNGNSVVCGKNTFLHEFVDVAELFGYAPASVKLSFGTGVSIAEIYGFGAGELPRWVQIWEPILDEADLLMISSHSDDEQLFFAGVLPYYAGELGLRVQVAYVVNHFDTRMRPHEQLDGLWEVGVHNYPIIPKFPDLYSESYDGAIYAFKNYGYSFDDFCEYFTETIRRVKPLVIVTHDINGEYGHGTHLLCTAALRECIDKTADAAYFPESADKYGVWDVEKVYLHLYGENQIVMDFDKPLEKFGGKTAFQVTQDGFKHHTSQHWTWFYKWIYGSGYKITKATEITSYSPIYYGLYRTTVGYDVVGGDFFENVKTYEVRKAEEAARETEPAATEAPVTIPPVTEPHFTDAPATEAPETTPGDDIRDHSGINPAVVIVGVVVFMAIILITSLILLKTPDKKRRRR